MKKPKQSSIMKKLMASPDYPKLVRQIEKGNRKEKDDARNN